jgi:hypothetical protein
MKAVYLGGMPYCCFKRTFSQGEGVGKWSIELTILLRKQVLQFRVRSVHKGRPGDHVILNPGSGVPESPRAALKDVPDLLFPPLAYAEEAGGDPPTDSAGRL